MNPYTSVVCDDFALCVHVNTKMELPTRRETVLHLFDSLQKLYPGMTHFECRGPEDYVLEEEDEEQDTHRWVSLEERRFCSGYVNPPRLEDADALHEQILELMPYHLDFSLLDCEALDVVYIFDLDYMGNHDEVVAEVLAGGTPFEGLIQHAGTAVLNYQPAVMLALDEACRLQCRLHVETRTHPYQVRTGQFGEAPISVYFTVRQYWSGRPPFKSLIESYRHQRRQAQELVDTYVVPAVVRPLAQAIAAKQ
jgi:hypothetical protein